MNWEKFKEKVVLHAIKNYRISNKQVKAYTDLKDDNYSTYVYIRDKKLEIPEEFQDKIIKDKDYNIIIYLSDIEPGKKLPDKLHKFLMLATFSGKEDFNDNTNQEDLRGYFINLNSLG